MGLITWEGEEREQRELCFDFYVTENLVCFCLAEDGICGGI